MDGQTNKRVQFGYGLNYLIDIENAVMHEVRRITAGAVKLGPGAIYTTIKRLLGDGLIEESDERPDSELDDQRRRYYRLTALGRAVAAVEVRRLDALVSSARPWALTPDPFAVLLERSRA